MPFTIILKPFKNSSAVDERLKSNTPLDLICLPIHAQSSFEDRLMTSSFTQGLITILPYNWSLEGFCAIFQVGASIFQGDVSILRTSKTWVPKINQIYNYLNSTQLTIRKPNKFLWNSDKSSIILAGQT